MDADALAGAGAGAAHPRERHRPGPALRSPRQTEADFARQCETTPLKRGTTPEEICDAVRFILAAPALTGQMIVLDGGQHLGLKLPPGVSLPPE